MTPNHYLHIYQKPALGNSFLTRKLAYQYRHQITAMGWYDTASCHVSATRTEAEYALENWVGNRVAVYVDNPAQPEWEGLISRVSISIGNTTFTRSLDDMLNKVRVAKVYTTSDATIPTINTAASQSASQAIYGVKGGTVDGYSQPNTNAINGHADTLRDMILALRAWPQTSVAVRGGGESNIINLEMVGFYQTLEWETYSQGAGVNRNPDDIITLSILPNLANTTTFFDNTDFSEIDANATYIINQVSRTGQTAWQFIQLLAEPGDGSARWIAGITPTNPTNGIRRLYYRQASSTIDYTARADQGLRVFNAYGKYVPPWRVRPDAGIRINDVLTAWNGQGDDPRETYIESVQYDAEQQAVYWQGIDDITVEGAFQLKRYFKSHGRRFGANVRTVG